MKACCAPAVEATFYRFLPIDFAADAVFDEDRTFDSEDRVAGAPDPRAFRDLAGPEPPPFTGAVFAFLDCFGAERRRPSISFTCSSSHACRAGEI